MDSKFDKLAGRELKSLLKEERRTVSGSARNLNMSTQKFDRKLRGFAPFMDYELIQVVRLLNGSRIRGKEYEVGAIINGIFKT